jgi:dinuclear metal center YbgI/SA1388 family protein
MASLTEIVAYCHDRLDLPDFPDYPGALNGLQMANNGTVTRIGAAVDAGLEPFRRAAAAKVDFLIVHHGMFWEPPRPWTGVIRDKLTLLIESNLAVFGAHLPLDAHPEIGNNVLLAEKLGLKPARSFFPFEGRNIGWIAAHDRPRRELGQKLETLFPRVVAIECGSDRPREIAIVTGGGGGAIDELAHAGVDTLITGELREHHFNVAQEARLNLYACGHYATEVFGVCALAEELAKQFSLPWEFVPTETPL